MREEGLEEDDGGGDDAGGAGGGKSAEGQVGVDVEFGHDVEACEAEGGAGDVDSADDPEE